MSLFNIFNKKNQQKKKQKVQQSYEPQATTLPQDFAQSVMDLQMKLEFQQSYTLEAVQELNQLYRIAIQYYINVDPRKAQLFQRKLSSLLTNPTTLQLIQNKSNTTKVIKNNTLQKQVGKFNNHAQIYIKSMLQNGEKKMNNNQKLIRDNLHKQQKGLKDRILQRSRSRSNKARKD